MEQKVLAKIQMRYKNKQNIRDEAMTLINELRTLEQNEFVKRYIELLDKISEVDENILNETDEELIYREFYKFRRDVKVTNKIYFSIGTFKDSMEDYIIHGVSQIRVSCNDPAAEYREYRDIESGETLIILIEDCEEFERNNEIIDWPIDGDKGYYQVQKKFVYMAVTEGQEIAKQYFKYKNKERV